MALFIVVWIDSWLKDWGLFGGCNTMLERILLVLSILAYILLIYVGSFVVWLFKNKDLKKEEELKMKKETLEHIDQTIIKICEEMKMVNSDKMVILAEALGVILTARARLNLGS